MLRKSVSHSEASSLPRYLSWEAAAAADIHCYYSLMEMKIGITSEGSLRSASAAGL